MSYCLDKAVIRYVSILSIIKTFFIVNFPVVRRSIITQILNFALGRKIVQSCKDVVVKINTFTKKKIINNNI